MESPNTGLAPATDVPVPPASPAAPPSRLWVGRTGRGAEVLMGPVEAGAVFTPGELLKVALAGCSGMSADTALSHRLGDDVEVTVEVSGDNYRPEDRYPALQERMVVDLSGLDEATKERLLRVVHRAVEQHCTVGNTLKAGATVDLEITGE